MDGLQKLVLELGGRQMRYCGTSKLVCLLTAMTVVLLSGCDLETRTNYEHEVEIAPGNWLTLKERRGQCWFVSEWKGKRVVWKGKRNKDGESQFPETLREYEGSLFLIVLDNQDMEDTKHVYFKLDSSGESFVEIPPKEFPKQIATQNFVGPRTRMVGVGNQWVDSWEALRKLDVEGIGFTRSTTADIWIELETGLGFEAVEKEVSYEERKKIVREFKAKYNPIALPTLVKEDKSSK